MRKTKIFNRLTIKTSICLTSGTMMQLYKSLITLTVIVDVEGRQIGRKDRLLGDIGTIKIPLTPLSRIGPPAERE